MRGWPGCLPLARGPPPAVRARGVPARAAGRRPATVWRARALRRDAASGGLSGGRDSWSLCTGVGSFSTLLCVMGLALSRSSRAGRVDARVRQFGGTNFPPASTYGMRCARSRSRSRARPSGGRRLRPAIRRGGCWPWSHRRTGGLCVGGHAPANSPGEIPRAALHPHSRHIKSSRRERGSGAKSLGQIPARSVLKSVQSFRKVFVTAAGDGSCRSVSTSRRCRPERVARGRGAARRRGGICLPLAPTTGQRPKTTLVSALASIGGVKTPAPSVNPSSHQQVLLRKESHARTK